MKTFQDLMREYPNRTSRTYLHEAPDLDSVVLKYNNFWGALSDTHMVSLGDSYIITGNRVNNYGWFRDFLTTDNYQGNQFPEGSFAYFMMQHNLCGKKDLVNNQVAFIINPWTGETPNPVFLDSEVGPIPAPGSMDRVTNPYASSVDDI